jgi:glycine/D-amino acid oxidase-like deaminating enzyme/nitrite reductase/ring-hydroxylating ferredoxin subunit
MNAEHERSRSLWMDIAMAPLPYRDAPAETDVLVIGAGIAGLTTAYELARQGRQVTVVDRGRFGQGMTARTTAHLAFELDDSFHELIKSRSEEAARLWYQSQSAAVDLFERICREEAIHCDFARLDGMLVAADENDVEYLRKELKAAAAAGFADAEWVEARKVPGQQLPAIRFPRQARLHPMKFVSGLIGALQRRGASLHEYTGVISLDEHGVVSATTDSGSKIRARQVLVATNAPFHLRIPIHTKQAPYRTFVIAAPVPRGHAADVLLWDTTEPGYHYVRLQPDDELDMLIVGGEDHKSGTADDGNERIGRLEAWARERWPRMGDIAYVWSGQVYEPADFIGFIGRSPQHAEIYVATGDSGQGMTTGGVAALLLSDLMNGRSNAWTQLYEPSRKMHHGVAEYLKENLEAARHWIELLGPGEADSIDDIPSGHGALVKMRGKPVAAYRDESGRLHLRSAVCTHAGCTVHWNGFERCWDCPCHGSQFSIDGEVLAGPAARPLASGPELEDAMHSSADPARAHERQPPSPRS